MVAFEFTLDEKFVSEMFARQRRTHGLYVPLLLRGLAVAFLCVMMVPHLMTGAEPLMLAMIPVFAMVLFPGHISRWLTLRRVRKSPHYREHVRTELDDEGITVHSNTTDARFKWLAVTAVHHFDDGVILSHGARAFRWLPFRCLVAGSQAEVDAMVRARVSKQVIVKRR